MENEPFGDIEFQTSLEEQIDDLEENDGFLNLGERKRLDELKDLLALEKKLPPESI